MFLIKHINNAFFDHKYVKAYSEHCQTSKMELFTKISNGWKLLTIFEKRPIFDVWQSSEYALLFVSKLLLLVLQKPLLFFQTQKIPLNCDGSKACYLFCMVTTMSVAAENKSRNRTSSAHMFYGIEMLLKKWLHHSSFFKIFEKKPIFDFWQSSENVSAACE